MKRTHYLSAILFLSVTFYANYLNAQHCAGASGSSVCTPSGTLTTVGFFPAYDSLPCVIPGVPYDQTLQFHTPASVTNAGTTYPLNWIKIDTLKNLPCGLCWRSSATGDQVSGNSTACIRITGTTYDAPGQFLLYTVVDANIQLAPFVPFTVANQNLSALGLKYYVRVADLSGNCPLADTAVASRTTTAAGSITAVAISGTNNICAGQTSVFSINAANYYAYKWSTGATTSSITVSTGGAYTVTAYAACTSASATRTLTINSNPTPTVTAGGATTFCAGNSVSLSVGAIYPAYLWSNGATGQAINVSQTGNYTCTVTQNGCSGTSNTITVTVNNNPAPTVTANGPVTFCTGGSVILDAGAGYAAYNWSNGGTDPTITITQTGNYKCTVTQNGCNGTSNTITVTVNNNPTPTVTANGPTTFCSGGSVGLNAGSGYTSYLWSNGTTGQTINAALQANYDCTVTQNGCSGTSNTVTVTINNNPTPTITANGPTTFCAGGNVGLDAGTGYSTYSWSGGGTTQSISPGQSGNYNCTVTQNGCSGTSNTITVTAINNPAPTAVANGATTFCSGGFVTLDAGAGYSNYLWSNGGTTQIINPVQSGNYSCVVTQNGCSGTSNSVSVTVNNNPVPVITANGSTSICLGAGVTLDAGAVYSSYSWSNGGTTQAINATLSGNYLCTVTQNGCSGTSNTLSVTVTDPTPVITPNGPTTFCAGGSVMLDAGTGFDTYIWSDGATSQSTSAAASGTYYITTTLNGCTGVSNPLVVSVTANNLSPAINAIPSLNICQGGTATLDAGFGYDSYLWSNAATGQSIATSSASVYSVTVTQGICNGTASATVNLGNFPVALNISPAGPVSACAGDMVMLDAGGTYDSYSWSNSDNSSMIHVTGSATYILTVSLNACTGVDSVDVVFHPLPQPVISPAGPVNACQGDNILLDAGSGFGSYAWSNGGTSQTTLSGSSGSFIVTVTQNGCTGKDTVDVNFYVHPAVSISPPGPQVICEGVFLSLDAGTGYSSYHWSNGDQTQSTLPNQSGTFAVTVTQNGCDGTDSVEVTINQNPVPDISPSGPVSACTGDMVMLEESGGFDTYTWSNNINGSMIHVSSSGLYILTVTLNACSGSDTVDVTFNAHPVVNISPAGPVNLCAGTAVNLDAGAGYSSYNWSNGEQTQVLQPDSSGSYSVTVMQNGCDGKDTVDVTFTPLPQPAISPASPVNICTGSNVTLDAGTGYSSYLWSNGDQVQTIQPTSGGNYKVTVTQNGCSGTDSVDVTFNPSPHAILSPPGTHNICTGESIVVDAAAGYAGYLWTNGATTQTITVTSTGTYDVTVTQGGCSGASSNPVTVFVNVKPSAIIDTVIYNWQSGDLLISNSVSGSNYEWLYGQSDSSNVTSLGNDNDSLMINCNSYGYYSVIIKNLNGCNDTSAFSYVYVCEAIQDLSALEKFSVQPNPASDVINISYELNEATVVSIQVIDITGRSIMNVISTQLQNSGEYKLQVRLNEITSGIYFLNFNTESGSLNSKFVKQ